jgi:hypothetical protein
MEGKARKEGLDRSPPTKAKTKTFFSTTTNTTTLRATKPEENKASRQLRIMTLSMMSTMRLPKGQGRT